MSKREAGTVFQAALLAAWRRRKWWPAASAAASAFRKSCSWASVATRSPPLRKWV